MPDETEKKCLCNWQPTINSALLIAMAIMTAINTRDLEQRPHAPSAEAVAEKVKEISPSADAVADKVVVRQATMKPPEKTEPKPEK